MKKRILAMLLCCVTVLTMFSGTAVSVSAASVSASLGYDQPENSGDYAYWSGSKVVKSSSTSKNEIKWMQAALNYCISKEGLSATKLSVDGSFGPASKKTTIAFQKAAGLTADGSFGPSTIKKMKNILNDNKRNSLVSTKTSKNSQSDITTTQTTENGVIYTYMTVTADTSSMDKWINSMKSNEEYVTKAKKGAIVEAKVLSTKTVTWKVSKASVKQGPGITGTMSVKYKVPATIQYKVHSHTRNTGFGSSWYYSNGCIVIVSTCNCGYRREIMAWQIPLPDFTEYSDAQTTQSVIQGLPQIN